MFQNLLKKLAAQLAIELVPFIQSELENIKNDLIAASAAVEPNPPTV